MAGVFQKLFSKIFGAAEDPLIAYRREHFAAAKRAEQKLAGQKAANELEASRIAAREAIQRGKQDITGIFRSAEEEFQEVLQRIDETEARREASRMHEPWYRFVHLGVPIVKGVDFQSSNVQSAYYDIRFGKLFVEYWTGWVYAYWPITEREANSIFISGSKGIWVWDNLRIRGTKLGHRKNYQITRTSSGIWPQWMQGNSSAERIEKSYAHHVQAAKESGARGPYSALGKFARSAPKMNRGSDTSS